MPTKIRKIEGIVIKDNLDNYNIQLRQFEDSFKAQRYLGNCYVLGAGVPQDYEKAEMWHDKAEENGCEFDEDLLLEMEKAFKS